MIAPRPAPTASSWPAGTSSTATSSPCSTPAACSLTTARCARSAPGGAGCSGAMASAPSSWSPGNPLGRAWPRRPRGSRAGVAPATRTTRASRTRKATAWRARSRPRCSGPALGRRDLGYINAHGSGTGQSDPAETSALRPRARRRGRHRAGQLHQGAAWSGPGGVRRAGADRHPAGRPVEGYAAGQRRVPRRSATGAASNLVLGRGAGRHPGVRYEPQRRIRRRQHRARYRPAMTIAGTLSSSPGLAGDAQRQAAAPAAGLMVRPSASWPETESRRRGHPARRLHRVTNFSPLLAEVAGRALRLAVTSAAGIPARSPPS